MLDLNEVSLGIDRGAPFSHSFPGGSTTVVLGANRSGKTDLCRLIAGLDTVASGQVLLDGRDLAGTRPQHRPVSLVYQAFVNYPNLSVFDNIASPLRAQRLEESETKRRVGELAGMLRIPELLDRLPHELSGGQQQRLAIARALAKDARVLLLDEPLVNLDFKLREALEVELRELLAATDTVVIYTSSDPRDAFALGDEVLLLRDGAKLQSGSPVDVYRNPANLAAMELLADPGVNRFSLDGRACALRPEHVAIGRLQDGERIDFEMQVAACETSGDESFIHGRVLDEEWVIRCHGMQDVKPGVELALSARAADVARF
jgi:glycerol transport system ATP-binding protein